MTAEVKVSMRAAAETPTNMAWQVRYTWEVREGLPHPEFTYEWRENETRAVDCAVAMLDRDYSYAHVRVIRAHIKAPDGQWRLVESW